MVASRGLQALPRGCGTRAAAILRQSCQLGHGEDGVTTSALFDLTRGRKGKQGVAFTNNSTGRDFYQPQEMNHSARVGDLCSAAVDRASCIALGLAIENDGKHAKLRNTRDPSQPHRWRSLLRGYCQCPGYSQAFASFTSLLLQMNLVLQ
jgi:hypothetical protein